MQATPSAPARQVTDAADPNGRMRRHPSHAATPSAAENTKGAHQGGGCHMPCKAMTASAAALQAS